MNSYQIINKLEALYTAFNSQDNQFILYLQYLSGINDNLFDNHIKLLNRQVNINDYNSSLSPYLISVKAKRNEIKIKDIFKNIEKLKEAIFVYENGLAELDAPALTTLIHLLEQFEEKYQDFLDDYSTSNLFKITESAKNIDVTIRSLSSLIFSIISNLQAGYQENLPGTLSLFIDCDDNYGEFVARLSSLQQIYSIICKLLQVSEDEFPLQIIKIESGSWWVKVFGEPRVIKIIEGIVKDTTGFFYRKYTTEGKIASLSPKKEKLEEFIGLTKKLEEAGIDTNQMKEEIEEASVLLVREFQVLLAESSGIDVNAELLIVENRNEQKSLRSNQIPLLKGNSEVLKDNDEVLEDNDEA